MLTAALLLSLSLPSASAADTDVQALRPATPGGPLLWVDGAGVDAGPSGTLLLHHADGLLAMTFDDGTQERVVAGLTRLDLLAGWGLGPLQLGLDLPVLARVTSDTLDNQTGLGDLALTGRISALQPADHPVGLGFVGRVVLPTTTVEAPVGGGGVGVEGRAAAETGTDRLRVLANLGVRVQPRSPDAALPAGTSLVSAAGAALSIGSAGGITGELSLSPVLGLDDLTNRVPAELLAGGWLDPNDRWRVNLGGGVGLGNGVGTPSWRLYAAVSPRPAPASLDRDGDSVPDDRDVCPREPETVNGVRDDDGCPEDPAVLADESGEGQTLSLASGADTDGDGIPDREDACPEAPEDLDGLADRDGCPEDDIDEDGIADPVDRCPLAAETLNGFDDEDGCPEAVSEAAAQVSGVVRGITFRTGSDRLEPASTAVLKQVLALLVDDPDLEARIIGHTDDVGDRDRNLDLSARRAASVESWLVARGIDPGRLSSEGKGPDQPIDTNATADGRASNRRVEITYQTRTTP